jgi:hypothetical protein
LVDVKEEESIGLLGVKLTKGDVPIFGKEGMGEVDKEAAMLE